METIYQFRLDERVPKANGKRPAKSWPFRLRSRTPAASRRAIMRKPSCLISCSQFPPIGRAGKAGLNEVG